MIFEQARQIFRDQAYAPDPKPACAPLNNDGVDVKRTVRAGSSYACLRIFVHLNCRRQPRSAVGAKQNKVDLAMTDGVVSMDQGERR